MEEFCPLCMKRGLKKKMKAIQINLEEAVWMCESEECIWPMDHKELEYISRKIGESWSCYWNTYKPQRSPVTASQSDWDFFTPPYTPRTEVSPTASSETSTHSNNDQNRLNSVYSKESINPFSNESASVVKEENMNPIENNEIKVEHSIKTSLPTIKNEELLMDITNPSVINPFSLNKLESISRESKNVDSKNTVNAQCNITSNFKTVNTRVPIIVNIEKMKLVSVGNIKKLPGNKPILKDIKTIGERKNPNVTLITGTLKENLIQNSISESKAKNLQENVSVKIENPILNQSRIEVKTVKLEGLPSVTLSYEVPSFLSEINNVASQASEEVKTESKIAIKTEVEKNVHVLSKKSIMASKKFQKFDFGELRRLKNLKKNDTIEIENTNKSEKRVEGENAVIEVVNSDLEIEVVSNNQDLPPDNRQGSQKRSTSEFTNFENFDKNCSPASEDSKDNIISELDSFLNEFIEENKVNINETLVSNLADDDWLSSLLA